jgi:hypothetical protein
MTVARRRSVEEKLLRRRWRPRARGGGRPGAARRDSLLEHPETPRIAQKTARKVPEMMPKTLSGSGRERQDRAAPKSDPGGGRWLGAEKRRFWRRARARYIGGSIGNAAERAERATQVSWAVSQKHPIPNFHSQETTWVGLNPKMARGATATARAPPRARCCTIPRGRR